ncbi:MAG: glycosyltransferase [candidate division Zixibacteria bacterium]|nr:glycosyltransferase [candidate division Zixibacteria bacterium]
MCECIKRKEKKVLIIAYYFPPLGMGGVQRATKFAKYLPLFGWNPFVLTVKDVEYLAKDPSLLEELSPEVEIVRTGSFDPLRISFVLKSFFKKRKPKGKSVKKNRVRRSKLSSWFFFPDSKIGWIPFALFAGLKLVREEKIDLIFTTSPPPSLHLAGYFLKLLTGKPWVADFRDPWIGYKFEIYPTFLHFFLKDQLVRLIVRNADRIISANPSITKIMMEQYSGAKKIGTINQGYDESDFETGVARKAELFTIGYLGTFSPDCDPEPLFWALRNLIDQKLIPKDKIKFIHVGLSMGMDLDGLIEKYDLKQVFDKKGYLPHRKALDQMKDVSIFLLVTSDNPLIFPAKVFEYLLFKKPILGIVPQESGVGKVILEMKLGRVVSPEDKNGIAETLLYYFSNFENKTFSFSRNEENVKKFDRRYLTSKLASIFDQITGKAR